MNRNFITTGYRKQLITSTLAVLFVILVFTGCEQKETPKVIVAKVGDRVLTEDQLDSLLSFSENKNKYENEVVRNWVESEILFSEAQDKGILQRKDYLQLVDNSNKKLANSIFISDLLREHQITVDDEILKLYYNQNKNELEITDNAFVFNRVVFSEEDKAIQFRSKLIESDWASCISIFEADTSLVLIVTNKYQYEYELPSQKVQVVLQNLNEGETSIIFESEPENFSIVQLVKNFEAYSVPDFEYVKELVKTRYLASQQLKFYNEQMQELFTKYDVIINR